MAAKKYLSLEEAAERLAMPVDELNKLREARELRGFADRGTWKFKTEDIEEFGRTRQFTSDPDVPLMDIPDLDDQGSAVLTEAPAPKPKAPSEADMPAMDGEGSVVITGRGADRVHVEDDGLADEPTLVRGAGSDSDVSLVGDDGSAGGGAVDLGDLSDSDSDVRLVSGSSGVDLSGGSSAAANVGGEGSDSDVRLIADDASDSDVALVADSGSALSGSSATGAGGAGRSVLDDDEGAGGVQDSQLTLGADSGIALESPLDSGIALDAAESGVILMASDSRPSNEMEDTGVVDLADADSSGITLDSGDSTARGGSSATGAAGAAGSGLELASDSETGGSSLTLADDSDIGLAGDSDLAGEDGSSIILLGDGGSGIALADDSDVAIGGDSGVADSGIALDFLNEGDSGPGPAATQQMAVPGSAPRVADPAATEADFTAVSDDSVADDPAGGADTSVILFEDDDEDEFGDAPASDDASQFELEEDFDDFEGGGSSALSAEVLDDDDDLDVFEADDSDFDESFVSGASQAEFAPGGVAYAPEPEFDAATVSLLGVSTLFLLFTGVLAFDLVRSMWGYSEPNFVSSTILDSLSSLYE